MDGFWTELGQQGSLGGGSPVLMSLIILVLAVLVFLIVRRIATRVIPVLAARTRTDWDNKLVKHGFFNRLAALAPGLLVYTLTSRWMGPATELAAAGEGLRVVSLLWILGFGLMTLYALLDAVVDIYNTFIFSRQMPIRGFVQVVKLVTFLLFLILTLSVLLGKSPVILLSGVGAMTAVMMLVFKDPILGFVAGIQLSANRMLAVGDWLEMPKYQADGDVVDVSLTTVKVRNWDQTITTIPTYALISDSFKNWRGINEAGGRRIKRSLFLDMNSIHFLDGEEIERLARAHLLTQYIQEKQKEVDAYNRENQIDPSSPVNGRRLTNLGTFRAYLLACVKANAEINQDMIMMVRQLQPTAQGLPIEIYAFTSDTGWVAHEAVQSDLFDHILAVVPQFGLRVFQSPSGGDIQALKAAFPPR